MAPVVREGEIVSLTVSASEITEREASERKIRYQADLLENVSDAVISTDAEYRVESWNKAAERIYGWTAPEVLGLALSDVVKPESPGILHGVPAKTLIRDGHYQGEAVHRRKDGTPITVWGSVSILRDSDGKSTGAVAVNRDITERKHAEEALRTTQHKLRTFMTMLRPMSIRSIWRTDTC